MCVKTWEEKNETLHGPSVRGGRHVSFLLGGRKDEFRENRRHSGLGGREVWVAMRDIDKGLVN